jgi:hypothetical protein
LDSWKLQRSGLLHPRNRPHLTALPDYFFFSNLRLPPEAKLGDVSAAFKVNIDSLPIPFSNSIYTKRIFEKLIPVRVEFRDLNISLRQYVIANPRSESG